METYLPKKSEIKRKWLAMDASQFTLGRLATKASEFLRGKHKPIYTPFLDVGDFVVVFNAASVKLTGRKLLQKEYIRHTSYPGGIRRQSLLTLLEKNPEKVIVRAVRNMLPTNKLRTAYIKRLKVVRTDKHNFKIDQKVEK